MSKKDGFQFAGEFSKSLFMAFLESAFEEKPAAPVLKNMEYDDDADEFTATWRFHDGHTEVHRYVAADSVVTVRTKARKCSSYTPVGFCEDRDCFPHRNEPAEKRPRIL